MTSDTPLRILVAEDERVIALHICRLLEKEGHKTVRAKNGDEAVKAVAGQFFDMVLMDIRMPEVDGLEATRRIRKAEDGYSTITIIGVSDNQSPPAGDDCRVAGMDHFIPKPFSIPLFEQALWQAKSNRMFT